MRILIEEYQYNVDAIKDVLYGIDALENVEGKVSIHYVGYYYNVLLQDCVFILPKVLLMEDEEEEKVNLVFGKYRPEDIMNLDEHNPLKKNERDFIYKFAVWIYRSIVVYKNDKKLDTSIVYQVTMQQVLQGKYTRSNTYLDILLSLIQFAKENQNFFFYIVKNIHSGVNRINWTRTIATQPAIIQNGIPVYSNPVNKKHQINFDEELIVIFFSILNHISKVYGFQTNIYIQYNLIKGKKFETYLNGYGCTRLRQIKYKYFSDKSLELWQLCYAFFNESHKLKVSTAHKEYLLVKNFYIVFEAIIDELIGDKPLPDKMNKEQEDGKIIDHLFTAKSLIDNENKQTYYIGDSKYYKMGHEIGPKSVYKQYTYARNVIQHNVDIFNAKGTTDSGVKLRDDITEGYNIIPNFFISAMMNKEFDYTDDGIVQTNRINKRYKKTHYENRLFDRDTLLLFHYDVNFLYVLSLYARNERSQKNNWKQKVRDMFRNEIQEWLQKDYDFYVMRAYDNVNEEEYIKRHFKELIGKIYKPFSDEKIYSLALERNEKNADSNKKLIEMLRSAFYVERCSLGQDPYEVLNDVTSSTEFNRDLVGKTICVIEEDSNFDIVIKKLNETKTFALPLYQNEDLMSLIEGYTAVQYLLIHNNRDRYEVFNFDCNGPTLTLKSQLKDMYTISDDANLYMSYKINVNVKVEIGSLNLKSIIDQNIKMIYIDNLIK